MSATAENDRFPIHVREAETRPHPINNPPDPNYPDNGGGQVHQSYLWETRDMGEPAPTIQPRNRVSCLSSR